MAQKNYNVRIPALKDIKMALEIFYGNAELTNNHIRQLFGDRLSSATIAKLKAKVREKMMQDNVPVWNAQCVNTKTAYEVWGLDVADLEARQKKLNEIKTMTA